MSIRICGGYLKGRLLKTPKGDTTRPTSEKLRQSFFNICQHSIEGAHFLDIFAGTGAMGLEALSRGAASATFIEQDAKAIACIKENIQSLDLADQAKLIRGDAVKVLKRLTGTYTHIYIDPPYGKGLGNTLLSLLDNGNLLAKSAFVYLEETDHTDPVLKRLIQTEKRPFQERFLYIYRETFSPPL